MRNYRLINHLVKKSDEAIKKESLAERDLHYPAAVNCFIL